MVSGSDSLVISARMKSGSGDGEADADADAEADNDAEGEGEVRRVGLLDVEGRPRGFGFVVEAEGVALDLLVEVDVVVLEVFGQGGLKAKRFRFCVVDWVSGAMV